MCDGRNRPHKDIRKAAQKVEIIKMHGTYNRTQRTKALRYIVIHYTGTDASAKNNCTYFAGGDRQASADYFVDDTGIYEYNDPSEGYYTWAVGDGKGKYGIWNYNSMHIEVVSSGQDFTSKEIGHLKELVPYLMNKFGITADYVVRHYDASRKQCPAPYIDENKWQALKAEITEDSMAITDEDVQKIAQGVWEHDIEGKWANDRLKRCNDADEDTSDPTGRGMNLTERAHMKYVAAKLSDTKDEVDALKADVNEIKENVAKLLELLSSDNK
jgi:N-acetyl-anhydromuramyl-L-alanine amidase AmpD